MPATSKVRLYLDIQFDQRITDVEALACAMDRLLERALSTPGILEEHGGIRVGTFRVVHGIASSSRMSAITSSCLPPRSGCPY